VDRYGEDGPRTAPGLLSVDHSPLLLDSGVVGQLVAPCLAPLVLMSLPCDAGLVQGRSLLTELLEGGREEAGEEDREGKAE